MGIGDGCKLGLFVGSLVGFSVLAMRPGVGIGVGRRDLPGSTGGSVGTFVGRFVGFCDGKGVGRAVVGLLLGSGVINSGYSM